MKNIKKKILFFLIFLLAPNFVFSASSMAERLSGRILLQVEKNGEAWYVNPKNLKRHFLGRPSDAFEIMRQESIGISNKDIGKIPVGLIGNFMGIDSDKDGLSDDLEKALGTDINKKDTDGDGHDDKTEITGNYNPLGAGKLAIDLKFSSANKGKVFLQVEKSGEAWYLDPISLKRYFLGRPDDAFEIMRLFGLGIKNSDLYQIESVSEIIDGASDVDENNEIANSSSLEKKIHDAINIERNKAGLESLVWNNSLSDVARGHSENLLEENAKLIDKNKMCNYPLIHHEGLEGGVYSQDRLINSNIKYFSHSGENIVLIPTDVYYLLVGYSSCQAGMNDIENSFKKSLEEAQSNEEKIEIIKQEIKKREAFASLEKEYQVASVENKSDNEIVENAVAGWMESQGHRENILNENFNETGIGISLFEGYMIATQVFIKKIDCGYKGGVCCQNTQYNYCFSPNFCDSGICQ